MEGFDSRVFDRSDHSLILAIGPEAVGFCLTMLDTILKAYRAEDMIDEPTSLTLVMLHELTPVIREHVT